MFISKALKAAILALTLGGLAFPAAPASATSPKPSPLEGRFAEDFSLLDPPVPAPLEVFADLDGGPVRLADFKGGVVLLNFWATWCAPCIREMPALNRLQFMLGREGLRVAAVSIDRGGKDLVVPFAKKLGLRNLPLYLDPKSSLARAFGVTGLPSTYLIDAQGRIVRAMAGAAEWDSRAAVRLIRYYLEAGGGKTGVQKVGG
jgi:thiol-disulfide isomerase/thioredoxin